MASVGESLDNVYTAMDAESYSRLKSIPDKVVRVNPLWLKPSPRGTESEGHYLTKLYIAWLYRDELVNVECEFKPQEANAVAVPDVSVPESSLFYEIETLHGPGDPLSKLSETIAKYGFHAQGREVRIIIPNLTALLYLPKLLLYERYLEVPSMGV